MDFNPFGVDVSYLAEIRPAPIRPLLERLDFTRGRTGNWGLLLRGPKRRVTPDDMRRIAEAMGALPDDLRQIE